MCEIVIRNINPNVYTSNILIDAFCKKGKMIEAEDMLNLMIERGQQQDIVTFNTLMSGHCLHYTVMCLWMGYSDLSLEL